MRKSFKPRTDTKCKSCKENCNHFKTGKNNVHRNNSKPDIAN